MIKKMLLLSTTLAMVLLSGCNQKEEVVSTTTDTTTEITTTTNEDIQATYDEVVDANTDISDLDFIKENSVIYNLDLHTEPYTYDFDLLNIGSVEDADTMIEAGDRVYADLDFFDATDMGDLHLEVYNLDTESKSLEYCVSQRWYMIENAERFFKSYDYEGYLSDFGTPSEIYLVPQDDGSLLDTSSDNEYVQVEYYLFYNFDGGRLSILAEERIYTDEDGNVISNDVLTPVEYFVSSELADRVSHNTENYIEVK